jgi:cyclopropane-fatty-acyl-phospholipid synthase
LSNDFFELFLDDTLTYSSGIFDRLGATLRDASLAKYDRLAARLDLGPDDHVIEIGTGWGGFALRAAGRFGCRVTTTTISEAQFRVATRRVAEAGLADRITVLKADYRDLTGRFSKLVSIEMIEAVGHDHYDTFFAKCAELLEPDGVAAIQAITIPDDRYEAARSEVDFIKRHIFPGSCIPSRAVLAGAAGRAGLSVTRADEIGLHYAETLRRWRDNFERNTDRITALGFDDRFQRLWTFYFCYCEGGFLERAIGTAQITFARPARTAALRPAVPAATVGAA